MEYRKALEEVAKKLGAPKNLCSNEMFMTKYQNIVESLTSSAPNGTDLNAISQTIKQGGELDDQAVNKIAESICSDHSKMMSDEEAKKWTKLQEEEIAQNSQKTICTMDVKPNGGVCFQTVTVYGASGSRPAYSSISKDEYNIYEVGFHKSDILYLSKGKPIRKEKSSYNTEGEMLSIKKILYNDKGTEKGYYLLDGHRRIIDAVQNYENGKRKICYDFTPHGINNHTFSFKGYMYDEKGMYTEFHQGEVVGGQFLSKTTYNVNENGKKEKAKERLFDIKCSLALAEIARRCGIPEYLYLNDIFMKKFKSIIESICSLDDERNCLSNIAKKIKEDGKLNDKEICSLCDRIKESHLITYYSTSTWSSKEHKPDEHIVISPDYNGVIFQTFTTSKKSDVDVGCLLDEHYYKDKNGQLHTDLFYYENEAYEPSYRISTLYNNNSIVSKDEMTFEEAPFRKRTFYYDNKERVSRIIKYYPFNKKKDRFEVASEYNYDYSNNDGDGTYTFSGREYDEDGVNTKYHIGNVVDGVKRYEQISHLDEKGEVAFYEKKEYNEDGTLAKRPESER